MRVLTRLLAVLSVIATATAQKKPSPTAFVLPITKHEPTKQFYTSLDLGTSPRSSLNLVLDLDTDFSWLNCNNINSSSTLRRISCRSSACSAISSYSCDGGFCFRRQNNALSGKPVAGRVGEDRVSIHSTDGSKSLARVSVRRFNFLCAAPGHGVAPPASGVLGLAGGDISFPAQVASAFNIARKFALCLPSYGTGRIYISGGPYFLSPVPDSMSIPLTLTPFAKLPGSNAGDYFLSVSSISVDGTALAIDRSLLSVDAKGNGGTKISTVVPYTVLHSQIYGALVQSFATRAKAMGVRSAAAVAPFSHCFEAGNVTGPSVPDLDLALPGRAGNVNWRFYEANTMVKVNEKVRCIAFVDGGTRPKNSIVIGTHQLQNYLIEFDLTTSIFGFSDALVLYQASCSISPFKSN